MRYRPVIVFILAILVVRTFSQNTTFSCNECPNDCINVFCFDDDTECRWCQNFVTCVTCPKNDGNLCTIDTCAPGGGCLHTLKDCDDHNANTCDSCNPSIGCVNCPKDDNIACTIDSCVGGDCFNEPHDELCNDNITTTCDICAPFSGGCQHISCVSSGSTCRRCIGRDCAAFTCGSDFNACTRDECVNGYCVHTPISCDDNNASTCDSCNPSTGCVHCLKDDNIACTLDSCVGGDCFNEPHDELCNDNITTTCDICAPFSGGCQHISCVSSGSTCRRCIGRDCAAFQCGSDFNACTRDECVNGYCVHTPISCDDNNASTCDGCDTVTGCFHTPCVSSDTMCRGCVGDQCAESECADSISCTVDSCATGTCQFVPHDELCDDSDPDTCDSCDQFSGCAHSTCVSSGTTCRRCSGAHCIQEECIDNDLCTTEECINGYCAHTPRDCSDNISCTIDTCLGGECFHEPRDDMCDDGLSCTSNMCDKTLGCIYTPIHSLCNDDISCTEDICDKDLGCLNIPRNESCNDNNPCTSDYCDKVNGCVTSPGCNDGDPSTCDVCDPIIGCNPIPCESEPGMCRRCELAGNLYSCVEETCVNYTVCDVFTCVEDGTCRDIGYYPECNWNTQTTCCNSTTRLWECSHEYGCCPGYTADECWPIPQCQRATQCNADGTCTYEPYFDRDCPPQGECLIAISCTPGNPPICEYGFDFARCDDGNPGTTDICLENGTCVHEQTICDDGIDCTSDITLPSGECDFIPNDTACDDGNLCTVDICNTTTGCQNILYSCDDSNPCTTDVCIGNYQCEHSNCTSEPGVACRLCDEIDGCIETPCTPQSVCDMPTCDDLGYCHHTTIDCSQVGGGGTMCCNTNTHQYYCVNGTMCCDGTDTSTCSTVRTCKKVTGCDALTGACIFAPDDSKCNDNILCTIDTCNPSTYRCSYTPSNASCPDDGNRCTVLVCNPTIGDPITGCAPIPDSTECQSDITTCRECQYIDSSAVCVEMPCDDSNPHTTDICNFTTNMCEHIGNPCEDDDPTTCDSMDSTGGCHYDTDCGTLPGECGICIPCAPETGLTGSCCRRRPCISENPCDHPMCNEAGQCIHTAFGCNSSDVRCCNTTSQQYYCTPIGHCCPDFSTSVCPQEYGQCGLISDCNRLTLECVYIPANGRCSDGIMCTVDRCDASTFTCTHTPTDSLCNDFNPCTTDRCDPEHGAPPSGCVREFTCINEPGVCRRCVETDAGYICAETLCVSDNDTTRYCNASGYCISEELNVTCLYPKVRCYNETLGQYYCTEDYGCCDNDVGTCPLKEECGVPHMCINGLCDSYVPDNGRCDDTIGCTIDECDPVTYMCTHTADNSFCVDSDDCTIDTCNRDALPGTDGCEHVQIVCDDQISCTIDTCISGICDYAPDNSLCYDSDMCTNEWCDKNNGCQYPEVDCDDNNVCTLDSCDKIEGCLHDPIFCPIPPCKIYVGCDNITGCQYEDRVCPSPGNCASSFCNVTTNMCQNTSGCAYGEICCDSTVCTPGDCCYDSDCPMSDNCTKYACLVGEDGRHTCVVTHVNCNDSNRCTNDFCDPHFGCLYTSVSCEDHNNCTTDTCDPLRGCVYTNISCDDHNKCTIDGCDIHTGCWHTNIVCNDNNPCTVDSCDTLYGCKYTPINCNDHNKCTDDLCNSTTGKCYYVPSTCDDNNVCTNDWCDPKLGCRHSSKTCNDNNRCTTDKCDPVLGCQYTPIICNDSNVCTIDTCVPASGCKYTPIACAIKKCYVGICDKVLGCQYTPKCVDNNPCTIDTCDETTGLCSYVKNTSCCIYGGKYCPKDGQRCCDGVCNNGNCCTKNDCPNGYYCINFNCTQFFCGCNADCADGDACTEDICDTKTGMCKNVPYKWCECHNSSQCPHSSAPCQCTVCDRGLCRALRCCDDGNRKTTDICITDPDTGIDSCQHIVSRDAPSVKREDVGADECLPDTEVIEDWNSELRNMHPEWARFTMTQFHPYDDYADEGSEVTSGLGPCSTVRSYVDSFLEPPNLDDITTRSLTGKSRPHHKERPKPEDVFHVGICSDDNPCTVDACDSRHHKCIHRPKNCDDGNGCTHDRCIRGKCVNERIVCPSPNKETCVEYECFRGDGICYGNDSCADCDNDGCTNTFCREGECIKDHIDCDDHNKCTIDSCISPIGTCLHTKIICDDGKGDTFDYCDVETGRCVYSPTKCISKDRCHINTTISEGRCEVRHKDCDDGNKCTDDDCDPRRGCTHRQKECHPMTPCMNGYCDPASGKCVYMHKHCDDLNECTVDSCDRENGDCIHREKNCDDDDTCTEDLCNPYTGACVNLRNPCDDHDSCTLDTCINKIGCVHTDTTCVSEDPKCYNFTCDPRDGTITRYDKDCQDDDKCTIDTCLNGACFHAYPRYSPERDEERHGDDHDEHCRHEQDHDRDHDHDRDRDRHEHGGMAKPRDVPNGGGHEEQHHEEGEHKPEHEHEHGHGHGEEDGDHHKHHKKCMEKHPDCMAFVCDNVLTGSHHWIPVEKGTRCFMHHEEECPKRECDGEGYCLALHHRGRECRNSSTMVAVIIVTCIIVVLAIVIVLALLLAGARRRRERTE